MEEMGDKWYKPYNPTENEKKYQKLMHRNIEESLDYRKQQEYQWEFAARRFNLLSDPLPDERMSNILIPLIKIVIMSRLGSMTRGEMDVTYIPGNDDGDKEELWKDCRRYVNGKCNYRYEMQQALMTMSLFGPGILYDGYRSKYQTVNVPDGDGGYRPIVVRDPRQSMIFTESVMPWHYLVSGAGRDHHDAPHNTLTRYMHYDSWVNEFARVPGFTGRPIYKNVESVKPGEAWSYEHTKKGTNIRTQKLNHKMVCVNYQWIPTMGLHMIESNGVLNWLGPNPYLHGRSPFSMLRLHPQMDKNGGQFSIYGQGDAWLLSGLDTLYQNVMNMFVDNFYFSNSSVIGVPQGLNLDLDDEEFYGGTVIKGAENMVVTPLGRVDGNSYNFMWQILNDLVMWATGVPFNQLTGGQQVTAYELAKKIEVANDRQRSLLKMNESYGLKNSEELKISNIFQFMTQEEWYAIGDDEDVNKLIEEGKVAQNDVYYEDGVPIMVRSYPMIETKGRVIQEKFVNNMPVPDGAKIIATGQSGRIAARPENIHPTEWIRNNGIPDVIVDSSTAFGPQEELEKQNTIEAAKFAIAQNDRMAKMQQPLPFNEEEVNEEVVKSAKKNPRKWLKKNDDVNTLTPSGEDPKQIAKDMKAVLAERDQTVNNTEQPQEASANPMDFLANMQGPSTIAGQQDSQSQQLSASAGI